MGRQRQDFEKHHRNTHSLMEARMKSTLKDLMEIVIVAIAVSIVSIGTIVIYLAAIIFYLSPIIVLLLIAKWIFS